MKKFSLKPAVTAVAETLHRTLFDYMQRVGLIACAAHTAVASHTDAIYAVSAALPATYDAAGYGATTITYTVIGKVRQFMPYGSDRSVNEWLPINGAVEYTKGVARFGQGELIMGDIPADAGQVILKAADISPNHYSMKITYADGEIHYLDIIVAGWQISQAQEGAPMERTAKIAVCRSPVVVTAP